MPAKDRSHYTGSYLLRARRVRLLANADPATVCWRCGLPARQGDPWEAGHTVDGDSSRPLKAEHRSCNRSATPWRPPPDPDLRTSRKWF